MKKLFVLLVAALIAMPLLNSCKKGENDPMISLKTRKARLTAEWELVEGSITSVSGGNTSTYNYNGSTYTSTGNTTPVAYTEKYTFEGDGTFVYERTSGLSSSVVEGSWYFGGKMKEQDLKAGETVVMVCTKNTYTANNTTSIATYEGSYCPTMTITIDQLKGKQMIIIYDGSETSGTVDSETGTKTFESK